MGVHKKELQKVWNKGGERMNGPARQNVVKIRRPCSVADGLILKHLD